MGEKRHFPFMSRFHLPRKKAGADATDQKKKKKPTQHLFKVDVCKSILLPPNNQFYIHPLYCFQPLLCWPHFWP